MKYLYLFLDLGSMLVPFLFSFHPKLNFYKRAAATWGAILITAFLFVNWDIYYTHLGVWSFNPRYLSGFWFFNLPIEEVLFFVCIPYSCLFTYHCLNVLLSREVPTVAERAISALLILFLLITGLMNMSRLYTFPTFILLAAFLLLLWLGGKVNWLGRFYRAYAVLLIPFLVINGILTGTGLDEPVVSYREAENLGIRLLTIPVEDAFYGMLMILMNVFLFEKFTRPGTPT